MKKLYKLLYILWSLKNSENRKHFLVANHKYLEGVIKRSKFLAVPPDTAIEAPIASPPEEPTVSTYNAEAQKLGDGHKVLLVVHEFSRTGAPYAVLYLAQALYLLYGVRPVVLSPVDGPLREEFEQEGFPTLVDPLLFSYKKYSAEACGFVAKFERIIVTSLSSFEFISHFRGIGKKLTWWIHETDTSFNSFANKAVDLALLFACCEAIWLGSPLCFPFALEYTSEEKLHLLLYGCIDKAMLHRPHKSGKIVFSIFGTVVSRKGQDVFLEAIEMLPETLRRKAIFRIIGSSFPDVKSAIFYNKVRAKAALIPEVECIESMPSAELNEFYAETDVLVSASREDPMPIVVTEGLMFSIVCLCSTAIGQATLLEDGMNGLLFTSGSAEGLSEKMAWIIQNPNELAGIGQSGREIYEKHFLMGKFIENVGNLIKNCP